MLKSRATYFDRNYRGSERRKRKRIRQIEKGKGDREGNYWWRD
jgi:hypothetical protein